MSPQDLKQIVRENIRARRKEIGLTQADLSVKIGASGAAVAQIERGHTSVSMETLANIADALGVQPSMLLTKDAFVLQESAA